MSQIKTYYFLNAASPLSDICSTLSALKDRCDQARRNFKPGKPASVSLVAECLVGLARDWSTEDAQHYRQSVERFSARLVAGRPAETDEESWSGLPDRVADCLAGHLVSDDRTVQYYTKVLLKRCKLENDCGSDALPSYVEHFQDGLGETLGRYLGGDIESRGRLVDQLGKDEEVLMCAFKLITAPKEVKEGIDVIEKALTLACIMACLCNDKLAEVACLLDEALEAVGALNAHIRRDITPSLDSMVDPGQLGDYTEIRSWWPSKIAYLFYREYRRQIPLPVGWVESSTSDCLIIKNDTYVVVIDTTHFNMCGCLVVDFLENDWHCVDALFYRLDRQVVTPPEATLLLSVLLPGHKRFAPEQ